MADTDTRLVRIDLDQLAALQQPEPPGGRHSIETVLDGVHMAATRRLAPDVLARATTPPTPDEPGDLPVPAVVQAIQQRQRRKMSLLWRNLRRAGGWSR